MSRKIVRQAGVISSFPNFIWERLLILAKFHFALDGSRRRRAVEASSMPPRPHGRGYEIGNEIASASAFPNEIWERGITRSMVLGFVLLGLTTLLRAQNDPVQFQSESEIVNLTPYQTALLDYKTGKYKEARTAIDLAEKANPGDASTEILKARILTELGDYAGAKKVLEGLNGNPGLTPKLGEAWTMAFGDMCLRKHDFPGAAKFYESLLSQKPGDPDLLLKAVYARIGVSDLVMAGKFASQLKPLDPKNPYDDHASYYFAKAALAQATGNSQGADDDIQTARTIYGITVTNRYLKTYLEVFASSGKTSDMTPPPLIQNPPPK